MHQPCASMPVQRQKTGPEQEMEALQTEGDVGRMRCAAIPMAAVSSALQVRAEAVRATVESLMDCLLGSGMSCSLAKSLISPISRAEPAHYISTLFQLGHDSQVIADTLSSRQSKRQRCSQSGCTELQLYMAYLVLWNSMF